MKGGCACVCLRNPGRKGPGSTGRALLLSLPRWAGGGACTPVWRPQPPPCPSTLQLALQEQGGVQIITAKCSEVNVVVVPTSTDADQHEHPVPEQFISTFKGGKLVTEAASHSGA